MPHYLAKSRQVLEMTDVSKLQKMKMELKAELIKVRTDFGAIGKTTTKKKSKQKNIKRSIARIETRLSQLRNQKVNRR